MHTMVKFLKLPDHFIKNKNIISEKCANNYALIPVGCLSLDFKALAKHSLSDSRVSPGS